MGTKVCTVAKCGGKVIARGYCSKHYQRWAKYGDPTGGNKSPAVLKAIDHADGTRTCTECGERKSLEQYDFDKSATLGRRSKCKACRSRMMKKWYQDNQERQVERARVRFQRDIDKIRINDTARYNRSKDKRIAVALAASHARRARLLSQPYEPGITVVALRKRDGDECYYCNVTMVYGRFPAGKRPGEMATIEHKQPISRGGSHTWDNCVLACWRCNSSRGNRGWTPEDDEAERQAAAD